MTFSGSLATKAAAAMLSQREKVWAVNPQTAAPQKNGIHACKRKK